MTDYYVAIGAGGASYLAKLKDATITNPADQQVLVFDAATGKWINAAAPSSAGNVNKYAQDIPFDGFETTVLVATNATITNSRNAIWQLKSVTEDYKLTYVAISSPDAQHVLIDSGSLPLPAGDYRLIGIE